MATAQQCRPRPRKNAADKSAEGWRLLLSGAILLNLVFFVLLAIMSGGIYNYSVVAFGALYNTPSPPPMPRLPAS